MPKLALVIIDMQNAYFNNGALEERKPDLLKNCNQLIDEADCRHVPIFNVRTEHEEDRSTWTLNMHSDDQGYLFKGSDDVANIAGLHVPADARELVKTRDSAFFNTEFAATLRKNLVTKIILCGVSTHSCIAQTASDAYAENIEVVIAREAVATHDTTYHDSTLNMLEQEYRQKILLNDAVIQLLSKDE